MHHVTECYEITGSVYRDAYGKIWIGTMIATDEPEIAIRATDWQSRLYTYVLRQQRGPLIEIEDSEDE